MQQGWAHSRRCQERSDHSHASARSPLTRHCKGRRLGTPTHLLIGSGTRHHVIQRHLQSAHHLLQAGRQAGRTKTGMPWWKLYARATYADKSMGGCNLHITHRQAGRRAYTQVLHPHFLVLLPLLQAGQLPLVLQLLLQAGQAACKIEGVERQKERRAQAQATTRRQMRVWGGGGRTREPWPRQGILVRHPVRVGLAKLKPVRVGLAKLRSARGISLGISDSMHSVPRTAA